MFKEIPMMVSSDKTAMKQVWVFMRREWPSTELEKEMLEWTHMIFWQRLSFWKVYRNNRWHYKNVPKILSTHQPAFAVTIIMMYMWSACSGSSIMCHVYTPAGVMLPDMRNLSYVFVLFLHLHHRSSSTDSSLSIHFFCSVAFLYMSPILLSAI